MSMKFWNPFEKTNLKLLNPKRGRERVRRLLKKRNKKKKNRSKINRTKIKKTARKTTKKLSIQESSQSFYKS